MACLTATKQLFFGAVIAGCSSAPGSSSAGAPSTNEPNDASVSDADADADAGGEGGGVRYSLFNGADFSGWDRYLGKPSNAEPALGLDEDPRRVYSIVSVDSEPAIRISGEVWGSLISKREFCNFRLQAEYRWGGALWPPLHAKDSGIMFLSSGPLGAVNAGGDALSNPIGSGSFLVSTEYQIAEGDVGGLYHLGPIAFSSSVHHPAPERRDGWNRVEISLRDDVAHLLLNDVEVSRASGFTLHWPDQPPRSLQCGKLQLQSEGAEIFFRRIEIEELP